MCSYSPSCHDFELAYHKHHLLKALKSAKKIELLSTTSLVQMLKSKWGKIPASAEK